MTVNEAGRLGGKKIVEKWGKGYMRTIGSRGGQVSPTKFVAGTPHTSATASKGGSASSSNFAKNRARASEAGKKGARVRKARAEAAEKKHLLDCGGCAAMDALMAEQE